MTPLQSRLTRRDGHFEVHSIPDEHADVTEGTGTGIGINRERCRYGWSNPGSVIAAVNDSNATEARTSRTTMLRPGI